MQDWSALPSDAIEVIASRLANDADYVRFRSVGTSWRSTAPKRPQLPWILVQYNFKPNSCLGLCNYPNTHLSNLHPLIPEGIARGKFFCGSSRGWIALLDDAPGISLHNPFTGLHIRLPPLNLPTTHGYRVENSDKGFSDGSGTSEWKPFPSFGTFLANNVVLSSDPTADDCVAMALCYHGSCLIYCRPGDGSWSSLSHPDFSDSFEDIIFYKGKFYVVSTYEVFVCDIGPDARVTEILPANPLFSDGQRRVKVKLGQGLISLRHIVQSNLVVSTGDLLLVTRTSIGGSDDPPNIEVFRVDLDGGHLRLFKLENLCGRALFLDKDSMSISVSSSSWCKGNCIYYIGWTFRTERRGPGTCTPTLIQTKTISVYDINDGCTSVITSIRDDNKGANCWGFHWLTPSLC